MAESWVALFLNGFLFWSIIFFALGFFLDWMARGQRQIIAEFEEFMKVQEQEEIQKQIEDGDYWDEGEIDYDTGEISSHSRPTVRHPKNADRAYSGSAERFHDGGW